MNTFFESSDSKGVLSRYEGAISNGSCSYFDTGDFEDIIDYYLQHDNVEAALIAIEHADAQHDMAAGIQLRKAYILSNQGYAAEALNMVEYLETLECDSIDIRLIKARALVYSERVDEGEALLNQVFVAATDSEDKIQVSLMGVECFMGTSRYGRAVPFLKHLCEMEPRNAINHFQLAYCYEQNEELEKSLATYKRGLDEDPHDAFAWFALGTIQSRLNMGDMALDSYDYAIALDEKMTWAYFNKAHLLQHMERHEESAKVFEGYLELDANNELAICKLGECYEDLNRWGEAYACYKRALDLSEECAEAYFGMASVFDEQGNEELCSEYLQRAVALEPENPEYWFGVAQAYMRTQRAEEAIPVLERVVSLAPYDYEAWMLLADAYLDVHSDFAEAIHTLERALPHNSDMPSIHYRIAALMHAEHDITGCLQYLENALRLDATQSKEFFRLCPDAWLHPAIVDLYKQYRPKKKTSES
ncbi:MAG: tetratricopeptide repeat protein [Prevotellaceae bacterium]|nr:tetratricopeptide repeat protein [Prevotellaceae bacterium]